MTTATNEAYFQYLDELRDSGVTNIYGAASYLSAEFGLSESRARGILTEWMRTFSDRHPRPKESKP